MKRTASYFVVSLLMLVLGLMAPTPAAAICGVCGQTPWGVECVATSSGGFHLCFAKLLGCDQQGVCTYSCVLRNPCLWT